MAKSNGLGDQLYIQGIDIGADVQSIDGLSTPRATIDATGITQSAMARLFGIRDGSAEFTSYFNPGDDPNPGTHQALALLPRTDVGVMYLRGMGLGSEGIGLVGKQIDYSGTRGDDGSLNFGVSVQANGFGIDWGQQLTVGREVLASTGSGDSIDGLAATAFGWQAYLQVFGIGSGTATVAVQGSSDDGVGDTFADLTGGSFTAVTAAGAQRIQSSSATAAVERYLRVNVTGTFTDLDYAVIVVVNQATRAI